jgi:prepilin-type processing-associated H-X9-DG protein
LEQDALFAAFDRHMATGRSALAFPLLATILPTLMCPSDPTSPKTHTFWGGLEGLPTQGFSGNYVTCAGNGYFNEGGVESSARLNGMFFAVSQVRLGDVIDGTSSTALSSEIILSPDVEDHDIRGRYHNPAHGGVLFSTRIPPNTLVPDQFNWCSANPVPRAPCIWTGTNMFVSPRSYHPGGVNLGLVDGSVRFVSDNIDPVTFRALGSRNGREVVGEY